MNSIKYNWKRFWYKTGDQIKFTYDDYLKAPSESDSKLKSLKELLDIPCLILLGEPGIGKTNTIEDYCDRLEREFKDNNREVLYVNLNLVDDRNDLKEDIFETEKFTNWLKSDDHLHLYLDSFDEALLNNPNFMGILMKKLKNLKENIKRLNLRIACRTGIGISYLEEGLKGLWGQKNVEIYQLAPLRRKDVIEALNINEINEEDFLEEVQSLGIVSLAIKPVTLNFLIDLYHEDNCLPSSQIKIYEGGCELLCDEVNQRRKDKGKGLGDLASRQRMEVASLIAVVSVLSNKNLIDIDYYINKICNAYVLLSGINGRTINKNNIEETFKTGLFKSHSKDKITWSHYTYAEYLAARYLANNLNRKEIIKLIVHPFDASDKIVPQLHSVAAWLAGMNEEVLKKVLDCDHGILFLSDLREIDDKYKEELVEKYLTSSNQSTYHHYYDSYKTYKNLNHNNLEEQIRRFVLNYRMSGYTRRIAIHIAIKCELSSLIDVFLEVIFHSSGYLQELSLVAFYKFADEEKMREFIKLLFNVDYLSDNLISFVLAELYPNYIHVLDLFNLLEKANLENNQMKKFIEDLSIDELKSILNLIINHYQNKLISDKLESFIDMLITYTLEFIEDSDRINDLVRKVLKLRLDLFDYLFYDKKILDDNKVKSYIKSLKIASEIDIKYLNKFSLIDNKENDLKSKESYIKSIDNRKLIRELLSQLDLADDKIITSWSKFVDDIFFNDIDFMLFGIIEVDKLYINSEAKEKILKAAKRYLVRLNNINKKFNEILRENFNERVGHMAFKIIFMIDKSELDRLESDVIKRWGHAIIDFFSRSMVGEEIEEALIKYLFKIRNQEMKSCFIEMLDIVDDFWKINSSINEVIRLSWDNQIENEFLERLKDKRNSAKQLEFLLRILLKKDNSEAKEFAEEYIKKDISDNNETRELQKAVVYSLMSYTKDATWDIVGYLLKNKKEFSKEIIDGFKKNNYRDIYNVISNKSIPSKELTELYILLYNNSEIYEYDISLSDNEEIDIYFNQYFKDYEVDSWCNNILYKLRERNDLKSFEAIKRIKEKFPKLEEPQKMWLQVEDSYLRKKWRPVRPEDILKMVSNKDFAIIQSSKQLLNLIIESLKQLQEDFQGENSIVELLWNKVESRDNKKDKKYSPKKEKDFSDFIMFYLRRDLKKYGIVFNREVEIKSRQGSESGQIIDIKAELINNDYSSRPLRVYIEVKGCWNSGLKTSMKEQLVERYMLQNNTSAGIYLIGWYKCELWDKKDSKYKTTKKLNLKELKEQYRNQAEKLSNKYNRSVKSFIFDVSL